MKDFLETTVGRILLGVIVVAIWGVNAINFSEMNTGDTIQQIKEVQQVDLDELNIPDKVSYTYTASARDPFVNGRVQVREERAPEYEQEEVEYQQPELVLTGVFDGMAVISDGLGQSYFLEQGETFKEGILVKRIVQDSVVLEHNKKTFSLKLN